MNIRILAATAACALLSSTALAGGTNPPGPGAQIAGSSTSTSSISNVTSASAVSSAIAASGGPSNIAAAITSMPGAVTNGNVVTSPAISMGGVVVTVSVNTATNVVTVTDAGGNVVYSGS